MITSSRRGFLTGLGAVLMTAPAIVRAGSLMPVKVMEPEIIWRTIGFDQAEVFEMIERAPWIDTTPYVAGDIVKYGDGYLKAVPAWIMDDLR